MQRHSQLDGLRGLAALVVVLHHWSLIVPGVRTQLDALYLPRLMVAGPQSVVIFFVLSGFVLFEAFQRYSDAGVLRWCGWRTIRLGVPTAACVTLSALFALLIAPHEIPQFSSWFNHDSWANPVSGSEWLRNVLPLDGRPNHQLDNATWSLSIELRFSLLFPLIAIAITRSWLVTLVATFVLSLFMPANPGNAFDLLWTLRYAVLFAAGATLCLHRAELEDLFSKHRSKRLTLLLVTAAGAALISDPRLMLAPAPLVSVGAILLVAVAAFDPLTAHLLRKPTLVWLGRVSFSLYLIHLPVLLALVHLLHGFVPISAIAAGAIPLTIFAAALVERWVERPAQRLARRVLNGDSRASASNPTLGRGYVLAYWRKVVSLGAD